MTVDKLGDNKLLIKLDESDMENFELDFGKMSFKNEDNQKVIIGLMRLACCRAGLDTNGKNVKIEAFLLGDECCILVTANPKKRKYRLKKSDSGLCWKMANASDFLNAVEACTAVIYVAEKAPHTKCREIITLCLIIFHYRSI